MENKIVIIEGSARKNGDTYRIIEGLAKEVNLDVISLLDYSIGHYDYRHANADDDFIPLLESLLETYDTFLFITPVYWYSMSGRMKVFFDRISDLLHYKKALGYQLKGKNMALVSVSNADDCLKSFAEPFSASASYLGMHFLGSTHIWVDTQGLSAEAQERLTQFNRNVLSKKP